MNLLDNIKSCFHNIAIFVLCINILNIVEEQSLILLDKNVSKLLKIYYLEYKLREQILLMETSWG